MALWIWLVAVAWPCQPLELTSRWPTHEADNVPVNTRVYLHFLHAPSDWGRLQVYELDTGAPVPGEVSNQVPGGSLDGYRKGTSFFVPDESLAPNSRYMVQYNGAGLGDADREITFQTGSEADTTPPVFDGVRAASASLIPQDAGDSCGGPERWSFVVVANPSPDAVAYRILRDGFRQVGITNELPARIEVETGDPAGIPNYCLSVEAVDAAGNVTAGDSEICVQAGLQEPDDTGPFEGFSEPVPTSELSGGSCPSGGAGLFLPLLLLGAARRRS